ncbi:RagB/SusD family nutrient uptake outer membrane protein [Flavobacterium sp. UBA6135]|uniref:RagB/SusD family nutrient uptake outer membrane protein n=1 Tax=Flavobacterium sp. UBA6135 TaxID=1946553 RepID=UPI0025C177C7|nr:RagB/SusD family nutrient uptake outer membrane protein [Flavobacterium sp. UBA6135]
MKTKVFFFMCFAFLMQSCEDDLDVVPRDPNQASADEFYAQDGAYAQAIAGVYGNLSLTGTLGPDNSNIGGVDAGTSQYGRVLWYMQNLSTDEVIWSYENDPGTRELQRNIWNASNPIIRGMFSRGMFQVALANEFLRQSTPEKLSARGITNAQTLAEIEDYRNEARALRALSYYHMLDLFGKAPFNTENDVVGVAGPQYNAQQLFEYIEEELVSILPNLKAPRTNASGRLDQGFARMVLAKLYLNAEVYIGTNRYANCAEQCTAIIGSGYTLAPNYLNNFKADNHTSPEAIFFIQSDGLVTQNYGPTTVMINGQVGSIEGNGNQFGVGGWGGALRLRKQFVQKFDGNQFNNDVRNTIISGVRDIDISDVANRDQGYILAKYSNISSTGVAGISTTFVDTDFPMFRLADVYLMYAECALRGAGGATLPQALTYVNALRERANNGSQIGNITSGQLTLNFILDERSRELHWEGHRRQDLIRFNRYTGGAYNWSWKGNSSNGVSISTNLRLYPIPQASLASNPNLTQNPGY